MSTRQTVLFVGLGVMGLPMARNVAATGAFELLVHDVDGARVAQLAAGGATGVDPAAAASTVDVLVLMLPGSDVVERVLLTDGLLDRMRAGAVVVDMSSSRPASTVELARRAADRGVGYVDAPVSGGRAKAVTGELAIMVGGGAGDVARVRPLLAAMGGSVVSTGAVGSGHALKALNNLLSAIGIAGAAEVLSIGARFGLDPRVMLEVINASTGRNHATMVKFEPFVLSGTFDAGFALPLMVKDLRTALGIAEDTDTPTPLARAVVDAAVQALADADDPAADHTVLARWVARRAGVDLHEATTRAAERGSG